MGAFKKPTEQTSPPREHDESTTNANIILTPQKNSELGLESSLANGGLDAAIMKNKTIGASKNPILTTKKIKGYSTGNASILKQMTDAVVKSPQN